MLRTSCLLIPDIALETTLDNATYYYGNSSAETITGTDGKDVIDSGGGDDTIDGGSNW